MPSKNMQFETCDVIITYSWNRVGYNILRSLTRQGLKVYTADISSKNICSMSKFCSGSFVYPDPFTREQDFIECLLLHIERLKPKLLFPTHDEALVIARNIEKFPKDLIIPISSYNQLSELSNKISATRYAQMAGIPIPHIYENILEITQYPVVFKTAIGNSSKGVFFPNSEGELRALQQKFKTTETFIQEKIGGGIDYSVDCIRMQEFFCASVYRALVTKTEGGGTTTQRIIVEEPNSKGTLEYLQAAAIVKKKHPAVRFMIIGRTEDKSDCIPQEKLDMYFGNGIVEQISYTNEVPKYLAACSVYVLPSYREGTPRSVLEAMSMARPIITTDAPGCRETVVDGDNGFLIPVKNVESLVEKMEWFAANSYRIEPMGERSHQICKEKFEVSKVNKTMNQIMGLSNV